MLIALDLIICFGLSWIKLRPEDSQLLALVASTLMLTLDRRGSSSIKPDSIWPALCSLLLNLVLRGAFFGVLFVRLGLPAWLCFIFAVVLSEIWRRAWQSRISSGVTPRAAQLIVAYSVLLRLLLIGLPELIPEEAYYWNYAQHLALGYLDHPPLSAWLIAASVKLLGNSEFSVRFPAWICSLGSLFFAFQLVNVAFDRRTAWLGAAIFASVPYFFGIGTAITPDAPLVTWWAASLYFLLRLIRKCENLEQACWKEWLGLGLCLGLGMLSKYTIALVGLSSLFVFVWHPPLRRYFLRPQPYLAVVVALAVFSPVIYWNATHQWASFAFQGSRRLNAVATFGLPSYLLHLLVLTTPTGIAAASWLYWRSTREVLVSAATRRFCAALFFVPLAVFLLFSLSHGTKIIWAGPAFLAALPLMARHLALGIGPAQTDTERYLYKSWLVMIPASLIGFGAVIYYPALGYPGVPYSSKVGRLIGWRNLGEHSFNVALSIRNATGKLPLIVGMDKHFTAAELSFYTRLAAIAHHSAAPEVAGRNLIGLDSLMFNDWLPSGNLKGKDALLVARSRSDLEVPEIASSFTRLGEVYEFRSQRNGRPAGRYFLRTVFGYTVRTKL